jgi:hypothetical protein
MPILLTPLVDVPDGSAEAIGGCLLFDNPVTVPRACPVMGESQEVKSSRTIIRGLVPILPRGRRKEPHQLRLGGMDCQTVLATSLAPELIPVNDYLRF